MTKSIISWTVFGSFLISTVPVFALNLGNLQGATRANFLSPNRLTEFCVIPKKWPAGVYAKKDIETESELCSYDLYTNMGICPKYNSTNPGVLLLKPTPEFPKKSIDASSCVTSRLPVKTEAKFKQSISCSYTPSILSYYQISRILGGAGRVPVAVIRTMDRKVHEQLTQKAVKFWSGNSKNENAYFWREYAKAHKAPSRNLDLFDSTTTQVFGALSDNPKKEEKYTEVNGKGDYSTRYQRFLQQPPFKRVSNSASARDLAGSSEFSQIAQTVVQLKDLGDMILLDTLLNQQDRIGNIHYKFYWYYNDPSNPSKLERAKSDAEWKDGKLIIPAKETQAMAGRQAALVKEMLLKDNDCGIIKENMMRQFEVLQKVRHFSYTTYSLFMQFERQLRTQDGRNYFANELLYSEKDFARLIDNASAARDILLNSCRSGSLQFDADLENYLPGAPQMSRSCEI
ncbi:MAG: hypothetical protein J7501_12730 [Bdellovibrio sp.]|nr:hypothetical protein [Bdellovibrio sp.]